MHHDHQIAILVANGFHENRIGEIQKALTHSKMSRKIVSSENGVVNGWADQSWGCFFPVDVSLSEALASDFSGLIVMGGEKSIERLLKTAHTQRFVESFIRAEKPILAVEDVSQIVSAQNDVVTQSLEDFIAHVENLQSDVDMAA